MEASTSYKYKNSPNQNRWMAKLSFACMHGKWEFCHWRLQFVVVFAFYHHMESGKDLQSNSLWNAYYFHSTKQEIIPILVFKTVGGAVNPRFECILQACANKLVWVDARACNKRFKSISITWSCHKLWLLFKFEFFSFNDIRNRILKSTD